MNQTLSLLTALGAGLMTTVATAQAAPAASAPAPAAAAAPAGPPQAIPAKVALIAFEQAVFATNEGQKAMQDLQAKYQPKKSQIDQLSQEVDTLKKNLQSATGLTDEQRATRLREIDTKEKTLNRDAEDANGAYQGELQEAYGKIAQKFSTTVKSYVQANGFTLLLDVSGQQSNVMWALQTTDVTQAVVDEYNKTSGVAAPAPSAPSAARPARPAASTAPKK